LTDGTTDLYLKHNNHFQRNSPDID